METGRGQRKVPLFYAKDSSVKMLTCYLNRSGKLAFLKNTGSVAETLQCDDLLDVSVNTLETQNFLTSVLKSTILKSVSVFVVAAMLNKT